MKVQYNKEQDILLIQLENGKIDDAYETKNMIVHVDDHKKPILLEIFKATHFFAAESRTLPDDIKEKFFAT